MRNSYLYKVTVGRLLDYLKNRKSDGVFRHSVIILSFTIGVTVLNILFRKYMATSHSIAGFGIYTPLLAIYSVLAIPFNSFPMFISRKMSSLVKEGSYVEAFSIFKGYLRFFSLVLVVVSVLIIAVVPHVRGFEKIIGSILPLLLIAALFVFMNISSILNIVYQSLQDFYTAGILNFSIVVIKFAAAFVFFNALSGSGIPRYSLALMSFVFAAFVSGIVSFFVIRVKIRNRGLGVIPAASPDYRKLMRFIVPVAVMLLLYGIQKVLDEIIVKHYLTGHEAGIYSAIISVGKASIYFISSIVYVLYPKLSSVEKYGRDSLRILGKGFFLAAVCSLAALAGIALFPKFIISLLTDSKFVGAADYLVLFYIAYLPFSFILVFVNFYILNIDWRFIAGLLVLTVLQIAGYVLFHASLGQIILVMGLSGLGILVFCILFFIQQWFRCRNNAEVLEK